jgi:hypothetical protein
VDRPAELPQLLAVPCEPHAVAYSVRVRLHNGRTFVGRWATAALQVTRACAAWLAMASLPK